MIYSVTMEQELPVRNLKPAVVRVYDYYQTSKSFLRRSWSLLVTVFTSDTVASLSFLTDVTWMCVSGDEAVTEYTSTCAESK